MINFGVLPNLITILPNHHRLLVLILVGHTRRFPHASPIQIAVNTSKSRGGHPLENAI